MLRSNRNFFTAYLLSLFVILTTNSVMASSDVHDIAQQELLKLLNKKEDVREFILVDVRSTQEYLQGHLPSAVHIPYEAILENISTLDSFLGKQMIFYCYSGVRVKKVTDFLSELGYTKLFHLKGDIQFWRAEGLPLVR